MIVFCSSESPLSAVVEFDDNRVFDGHRTGRFIMDRLVSGAWLEKELAAPDLRVLDCTVLLTTMPDGRRGVPQSGRLAWEEGHIPGSAHVDLLENLADRSSQLPFMLPPLTSSAQ